MTNMPTMVKAKRIFLARHGESVANQKKLLSGQLDFTLTEKGFKQAQWLCDVLKNEPLAAIYASSLDRAMTTAQPTAAFHHIQVQPVEQLKEINLGVLQGKATNQLNHDDETLWQVCNADKHFTVPDGESFHGFRERILDCFTVLLAALPDNTLIVGHRNTNQVILGHLLRLEESSDKAINVKNKYLYEIHLAPTASVNTIRLGGEFHGKKYAGLKDD